MDTRKKNTFRLLTNGEEFFPRVRQVLAQAQTEIFIETFILADDKVGRDLRQTLIAAAHRGVLVHVTVDGYGSDELPRDYIDGLTASGVRFHVFDPKPRLFGIRTNIFRRMHRKIVCVDGRVALLGGINFSVQHLRDYGPMAKQDYALEVRGPLASEIASFTRHALTQPGHAGRRIRNRPSDSMGSMAETEPAGDARLIIRDNDWHRNDIEDAYRVGIQAARSDIIIANSYFFPGYRLLREIAKAARRGVRTRLILQGEPDMRVARDAARLLYDYLVDAGVEIHEHCTRPLHGKVACIDDTWTTIGSSNLDPFSLALNLEANIFVHDRTLTATLRQTLERLITENCKPVAIHHKKRGGLRRLWMAVVVFHFLRRFPAWSGLLPAHKPQLESMPKPSVPDSGQKDTP